MTGMEQPEGKAILFINDVFGINSLGEALRMNQAGFGGKQIIIYIWHPAMLKIADCFTPHRPPLVYPSLGPTLTKFYVRKEADAAYAARTRDDHKTPESSDHEMCLAGTSTLMAQIPCNPRPKSTRPLRRARRSLW